MYDQLIFTGPPAALERCYPVLCAFDYCGLAEEGPPEGITWRVSLPPTAPRAAWEDCLQRCLAEGRGAIRGRIASAEAIDWANQWRAFFAPIRIGAMEIRADDIVPNPRPPHRIYLQPGMAFGTGQHPTTRLVAAAIAANAAPWRRLLDLGTGSGILAMIAAGCGVEDIDAVETDPETARVARENIVRNRMTERIRVTEDLRRCAGPYDAIVANILLEPLVALAPAIAERLAPNGMCYCSGILREQETVLVHAYANAGLRAPAIAREGEWSCVGFTRGT